MDSSLSGRVLLNQYRVEEFITQTPLGELYRGIDERTGKSVALTLLPEAITKNPEDIKSIESKSNRVQGISHPNLNKYFGLLRTPTQVFLFENWVDGPSLKDIMGQGRLRAEECLFYARGICNGLEALHKQNFLHLHLAPELIRVNQRGEVILCGHGNANFTESRKEHELYPPLYQSPEQLQGQAPGTASDIYSLTVILYELITGGWINGKSAPKTFETIRKWHLNTTPPAPASLNKEIPDHFSRMILWALRKNPDERLKTTTELISSLALALQMPADKIPPRADPKLTPVTSAVLNDWKFLPPPKPTSISSDTIPLEERIASVSSSKKKNRLRLGFVPVFLFILVAGFISLLFFVRPAATTSLPTPLVFTPITVVFTPQPSDTPQPRPTETHGGRIVFTCTRGDYNQLCMINRDGSGLVQLTNIPASNYYPIFSPDGSSILFASNRSGPFDLFLMDFAKKDVLPITTNVGNVIAPDYSPDGRHIIFANKVGNNPTAIWMVNADGLNPHLLYTGAGDIVAVTWSPDGERIAYAMNMGVPQEYEIFTMDANGRNHIRVSQGLQGIGGSLDWSPDGKWLLVYAGPFSDKDIYEIDPTNGNYVQVTHGGNNAGGSYSPDGKYIVFNSLRNNDQADLYVMNVDGTNQIQLTNDPEPDWGANWIQ